MTEQEKIDKWIDEHDGEDCKGMVCYGGAPIEPACCSYDIEELLDTESILEDIENGEE